MTARVVKHRAKKAKSRKVWKKVGKLHWMLTQKSLEKGWIRGAKTDGNETFCTWYQRGRERRVAKRKVN